MTAIWTLRDTGITELEWVREKFRSWGADFIVTRGRKVYPEQLCGFVAESPDGKKVGLVTYEIRDGQCEIVTLDAFEKYRGIGSALLERVCEAASKAGVKRVWLITTNDNVDALRFYQRRGFVFAAVHANALVRSREIKPSIPLIGGHGIPLRDEIEMERKL